MYARNTFCFTRAEQIIPLQQQLLPQRWNAITSVLFDHQPDWVLHGQLLANHELIPDFWVLKGHRGAFQELVPRFRSSSWLYFWGAVDALPGLERVVVRNTNLGLNLDVLPALLQVKKSLKVFDVHVTTGELEVRRLAAEVDLRSVQFKVIQSDGRRYLGPNSTLAQANRRTLRL